MEEKITVYAVVGATASGKSALALALAKKHGGEIVSCDSMQIYKRMDIGTAKPTFEELSAVPHHMIDIAEPTQAFSCADYVSMADKVIRDIHSRGRLPIICGGTGLYLDSLLRGADFQPSITDEGLRSELLEFARANGVQALHDELRKIDEESAEQIHPNNVKRVARAIEIYRLCGIKKSEIDKRSRLCEPRFNIKCVGLFYEDRQELYDRIDERVDIMLANGLVEETKTLFDEGVFKTNSTAAQAIGYKEIIPYIEGNQDLVEATEILKMATRRYAKRQITWFSSRDYVTKLLVRDSKNKKTFEDIVNNASEVFFSC
ncbi:MAG: tRNA (adenosine(37)-N6)-dimethylallyltransferase MiaA [Clostridia bacterium]|nr:tRNA (adenosine(37)-N6)-dimethylallyltransferase MiaA [Clostridia bacterium]